ncbi:hypothetical protein [Larkinella rosea]|uniref:Uncharacterized protein n=1 Tax=Larkinella rosea TaxID=2025312 RepID=A0A3P1BA76_9BACT|nr:hypothetical protein [Larkinella rosea]RRA97543.1 hypothetical protein EHT25_31300 [Larkinella rosea]
MRWFSASEISLLAQPRNSGVCKRFASNGPVVALEVKLSNSPILKRGTSVAQEELGQLPILVVTPSAGNYPFRVWR